MQQDDQQLKENKQFQQLMSKMIISEQTDDDKRYILSQLDKQDYTQLESLFELEVSSKNEFLSSAASEEFVEMLVIQQLRRDFTSEQPFLWHISNMEKAMYKAVRNILVKKEWVKSKEEFKTQKGGLLRIFQHDIQVGYITSTGQLKATSYIYVHHDIMDLLASQQQNLNFKKLEMKITTTFFSFDKSNTFSARMLQFSPKHRALSSIQFESAQKAKNFQLVPHMVDDLVVDDMQVETNEQDQQNPFPLWHRNSKIKQSFVRNGKFDDDFLILNQYCEDMKEGISISFVYRPFDDQVYAVKRSQLSSAALTFQDVFSNMILGEMTPDQRKIREAKILSKLIHPNILRLYDWWIEEHQNTYSLYMQLELCSYPGYKHQTNDLLNFSYYYLNPMHNALKVATIKTIMFQIIDALEYIHFRGIVHRDLKPENIFVTIDVNGQLQIVIADFDQGKDVRISKLSSITEEKIPELELNSIKSKNTIQSGTSGYTTSNSLKDRAYDQSDEFYALGVTLLHLVIAFPGEPKNRNHYATTFTMSDIEDVLLLFDNWTNKFVKNKHKEFSFASFQSQLELARSLLDKKIKTHDQIRQVIDSW